MAEPYLKKDPGEIIRAQDWNAMQSKAREHVAGHTHAGDDQGPKLGGAAIAPDAELKVKSVAVETLSVSHSLSVSDKIQANGSSIYFTKTDHAHSGLGNLEGHAAIENAAGDFNTLMIMGRTRSATDGKTDRRYVGVWDHLDVHGDLTVSGALNAGTGVRMSDADIRLRTGTDLNHGLGWYGEGIDGNNTKEFDSQKPDGPVLYGFAGGGLGSTNGGQKLALTWDSDRNVKINNDLIVKGNIKAHPFQTQVLLNNERISFDIIANKPVPSDFDNIVLNFNKKFHTYGGLVIFMMTGSGKPFYLLDDVQQTFYGAELIVDDKPIGRCLVESKRSVDVGIGLPLTIFASASLSAGEHTIIIQGHDELNFNHHQKSATVVSWWNLFNLYLIELPFMHE